MSLTGVCQKNGEKIGSVIIEGINWFEDLLSFITQSLFLRGLYQEQCLI